MPQNLLATAISSSQIDLSWDPSTDNVAVVGYRIYRDNVLVDTSPTNAYADTGLDPATEYEYEVSAIDAASNESARSTPDSATTAASGDTEAPSIPQNLSATAASSSQIDLTWDASSDNVAVTGYNIYRDNVLVDTSPTNTYADSGLAPGTQYQYEVSAFDAASNESARSAPDSATTHQVIVTAGLIAEWRFDAGAGQIVTDHSGNGHNAILGPTAGVDASEPVWSSTGVDCIINAANNYISTGSNLGISGGAARTVIVVAQIDTNFSGSNTGYGFFKWTGAASTGARWMLRTAGSAANLRFETTFGQGHTSSLLLSDETWHFIAASQSSASANTIKLYLDGASENSANGATLNTSGNAFMGPPGVSDNGSNKWGKHAYALVYDRALSDAEIEQNRQALKAILAGRGIMLP